MVQGHLLKVQQFPQEGRFDAVTIQLVWQMMVKAAIAQQL
jgi:hypothetical protein